MSGSRIIVALDYPTAGDAWRFVESVHPDQCRLKVGLELFTVAGAEFLRKLIGRGFDVFLDLKFHDIPATIERACRRAAELGVWMLNVHCMGGAAMLRAARGALDASNPRPILLGVTVLTSHGGQEIGALGLTSGMAEQVYRLAQLARDNELDGVVCSALEAAGLRARFGDNFVLVTPGIRAAGSAGDDQVRTATPRAAVEAGADYLVIGRPITRAADPSEALQAIDRELLGR